MHLAPFERQRQALPERPLEPLCSPANQALALLSCRFLLNCSLWGARVPDKPCEHTAHPSFLGKGAYRRGSRVLVSHPSGLGDARHTRHIMDHCLVQALPTWHLAGQSWSCAQTGELRLSKAKMRARHPSGRWAAGAAGPVREPRPSLQHLPETSLT